MTSLDKIIFSKPLNNNHNYNCNNNSMKEHGE